MKPKPNLKQYPETAGYDIGTLEGDNTYFWYCAEVASTNKHRHACARLSVEHAQQIARECNLYFKVNAQGMVAIGAHDWDGITLLPFQPEAHEFMSMQDAMLRVIPQAAGECEFCAGTLLGESHSFACNAWRRIKGRDHTAQDLPVGCTFLNQ